MKVVFQKTPEIYAAACMDFNEAVQWSVESCRSECQNGHISKERGGMRQLKRQRDAWESV